MSEIPESVRASAQAIAWEMTEFICSKEMEAKTPDKRLDVLLAMYRKAYEEIIKIASSHAP
jgi:predicted component of type VI protein secretion system